METDDMIPEISKYPNGTFLRIIWNHGSVVLEGEIDTLFETYTVDLEDDDPGYMEYHACAFMIKRVVSNSEHKDIEPGRLIEVSVLNRPTRIELEDGSILWEKKSRRN